MARSVPAPAGPLSARLALAALSAATLGMEVLLTRLLSYTVRETLIFFVVGIGMLGFGAAGSLVATRQHWLSPGRLPRQLVYWACFTGAATTVAYAIFLRVAPSLAAGGTLAALVAASVLVIPFLGAGTVVTLMLSAPHTSVSRLYAWNLVGSGVGCFLPLALLRPLGAPRLLAVIVAIYWLAALLYSHADAELRSLRKKLWLAVPLVASLIAGAPRVFSVALDPSGQVAMIERFHQPQDITSHKIYDRWNPVGRVEVFEYQHVPGSPTPYPFRFYAQDNTNGAVMAQWDGQVPPADPTSQVTRMCRDTLFGQGYFEPRSKVLVIGVGGGVDVQCALYNGASQVDAVEINSDSVAAILRFDSFLGGIGSNSAVHYHVQDGRGFAHGVKDEKYDLIQLSGVDTKHSMAAGGLVLSENHLYTREAAYDYLKSLKPGGVVSLIRFGEWEGLRLVTTFDWALRQLGAKQPGRHIIVLQNGFVYGVIVSRTALTETALEGLRKQFFFTDRPYQGLHISFFRVFNYVADQRPALLYAPGQAPQPQFRELISQLDRGDSSAFQAAYPLRIAPATDDRPFFFDVFRYDRAQGWQTPHMLIIAQLLGTVLVLALVLILLPLRSLRRSSGRGRGVVGPVFFVSIGVAYVLIEIWLMNRFSMFLGHQSYSVSLVLATLLVFTGLGAGTGHRLVPNQAWRAALGTALSAGILLLWAVGLGPLIEAGWQLSLTARMLLTALVTAPTGYFMGFAFPGGISWLKRTDAPAVPWSVGLNAFGSVWGSVAAVPLSLLLGYSWVFGIGVGLYLIACLSALSMARSDPARARPSTPAPVDGALLL